MSEERVADLSLDNLRYAFDYCVFGFPNATDVESSPCVTSEACGRIEDALKDGIVEPAHAEPYGYCAVDNSIMTSGAVDNCLSCVRAGSNLEYVSNCKCTLPLSLPLSLPLPFPVLPYHQVSSRTLSLTHLLLSQSSLPSRPAVNSSPQQA